MKNNEIDSIFYIESEYSSPIYLHWIFAILKYPIGTAVKKSSSSNLIFKLENVKNQVQIDRGNSYGMLEFQRRKQKKSVCINISIYYGI